MTNAAQRSHLWTSKANVLKHANDIMSMKSCHKGQEIMCIIRSTDVSESHYSTVGRSIANLYDRSAYIY